MNMQMVGSLVIGSVLLSFTPTAQALTAEEIYQKVNSSVYTIYTVNFYNKTPESLGSAIAVTDHILATNCHVALTGNYLGIVVNKEFKLGTLFFRDVNRDICFIEVPGNKFTPVKIRASKDVHVGEPVFAIGNPEGLEKSISQGIVSNKRPDRGGYVLQTDATVSFGSSGGGLFDKNADLVGITNSIDKYTKHIAFALPTEWITQVLFPKIAENKQVMTPLAGNMTQDAKVLRKLGNFGKANIGLYEYNQKCFVLFYGKNEFGEATGSAIWYPEKPEILLIFPRSQDVKQNFVLMGKVFRGQQRGLPDLSNNILQFNNKKYQLVGIKDENGQYPLLVTRLPADSNSILEKLNSFDVTYGDGLTTPGYTKVSYGLDGYNKTISSYGQQCKSFVLNKAE